MRVFVSKDQYTLGEAAAKFVAKELKRIIAEKGEARIILSTGASQFDTLKSLITKDVDWTKVEMFHLDEYVNLPETHIASFRKYLKERFINLIPLKAAYLVDGTPENIEFLTKKIREKEVDIGLIGIGENAHIAFNDPPANFYTTEAYHIVNLNDTCKKQQVREGWFPTVDDVPKQACSMTVYQILRCKQIVSCVPSACKADAIQKTLETAEVTNLIPATIMKQHPDFVVFADRDSFANVAVSKIVPAVGAGTELEYVKFE